MPVVANLATLKSFLGVIGDAEDDRLTWALEAAIAYANARGIKAGHEQLDDVQYGHLMGATRLYSRRRSPEGAAGISEFGVVRILANDPDYQRLMGPHWDITVKAGVA